MTLVYLDIESTGLNVLVHDVIEIAWAVDDNEIESAVVSHTLQNADPKALKLNGYWDRQLYRAVTNDHALKVFMLDARDATIVGSNPTFDTSFLQKRLGVAVWKHRLLDIAAFAAGVFGWDEPKMGMFELAALLERAGYDIPQPDHTAAGDVASLRVIHRTLRDIAVDSDERVRVGGLVDQEAPK